MPTQILGMAELKRGLEQLPVKMQQNVLASGNRAVANALAKEVGSGGGHDTVKKAVIARANPRKRVTRGFLVGLRKPFSRMSHWFEFGTGPRFQKTTGRYVGRMPATPWLRPALERIGPKAEEIWARAASRNFALQLKKLIKS